MKLIETILNDMKKVSKPQKKFLLKAIQAFLSIGGKLTFSNMCRYVGLCEKTFARQFSKQFCFAEFNQKLLAGVSGKDTELAVAFDPFFMPKSGGNTHGLGKFWSGGNGRVEKGLEASVLCIVDLVQRTAYALSSKQTPTTEEIKKLNPHDQETSRIDWFVSYVTSLIPFFPSGVKHILVDAYFFKEKFVAGMCEAGLYVVSKLRKDARLISLYMGPQKVRGRRKKFGEALSFDGLPEIITEDQDVVLKSSVAHSMALNRTIQVVLVRKKLSNNRVMEALLFTTDLALTPLKVYEFYTARFQIEFVIRDAKQYMGLTHCQSRKGERIDFHINLSFLAFNIAKVKELERSGGTFLNTRCSIASQHVMHHNEMLMESFFPKFGLDICVFKSTPGYQQALGFVKN